MRSSMIGIISSGFLRECFAAATAGGASRSRTWSACAPLRPSTMPNSTRCPFPSAVVPPVIAGEEAEPLFGVIPLDLAGRHEHDLTSLGTDTLPAVIAG